MFFRIKPAKGYRYLQIARSVRHGKTVRQEIIATLGRLDVLEQSGQLESLLRSGLRFCKKIKVLDAHAAGETQPVSIRKIGPNLVFGRLWKSMGLEEIVRGLAAKRRHGFDLERAVYLTVLHRLFPEQSFKEKKSFIRSRSPEKGMTSKAGENKYLLRVKTQIDSSGEVKSCNYVRLENDLSLFGVLSDELGLKFTYYFNPTPNDRNLEFDSERNLFGELPSNQKVIHP